MKSGEDPDFLASHANGNVPTWWRGSIVRRIVVLAQIVVLAFLAGCASEGTDSLDEANTALSEGRPVEALLMATTALLEDPELGRAKRFLRDNADRELGEIEAFLASTEGTTVPEELEQRFDYYTNLVTFYGNLELVGLPITEGKRLFGLIKSWEWTTEIKDYRGDVAPAKAAAREGFLAAGYEAIDAGSLERADALMTKAVTKFAEDGSEQQDADEVAIAQAFADHAAGFLGSTVAEELLHAIAAFELAQDYDGSKEEYDAGQEQAERELSEVYLNTALVLESEATLESLIEAVSYFELALEYNFDNTAAEEGIDRASTSIAELYYQDGLALSEQYTDRAKVAAAITAFENADDWVGDYKDSVIWVARMEVADELISFSASVSTTKERFDTASEPLYTLSSLVNSAKDGMDKLNYIADKVVQLDEQLRTLSNTLTVLSAVPVVGTAIGVVKTPLQFVRPPVHATAESIDNFRDPFVTPAREVLATTKGYVDNVIGTLDSIKSGLERTKTMGERLFEYIREMEDIGDIEDVKDAVEALTEVSDEASEGLAEVNEAQADAAESLQEVAAAASLVDEVSSGIESFMRPLDAVKGVTDAIGSALTKEISVPFVGSFSVASALESANGVVESAAKAVINPLLDALDIDFPTIPGIEELQEMYAQVEGYYDDIVDAADAIEDAVSSVVEVPGDIDDHYRTIVELTGYQE